MPISSGNICSGVVRESWTEKLFLICLRAGTCVCVCVHRCVLLCASVHVHKCMGGFCPCGWAWVWVHVPTQVCVPVPAHIQENTFFVITDSLESAPG